MRKPKYGEVYRDKTDGELVMFVGKAPDRAMSDVVRLAFRWNGNDTPYDKPIATDRHLDGDWVLEE